jgi:tetratricopeptide (TPR) repeat protein
MENEIQHSANSSSADSRSNDLFLSYNHADRESVITVRRELQVRGVSVFFDSEHLLAGLPWIPALDRAIQQVRAVAVFIGKGGLGNWQMREVSLSLDRQVRQDTSACEFPVIPVLLPGANIKDAFGFLLLNSWIDLRQGLNDTVALDALARAVSGTLGDRHLPAKIAPLFLPPYRALRPFREADAPLFFGRDVFARDLQKKTSENRLVAIVGPSGSGKSSVVQAGLVPLLRRARPPSTTWDVVVFTPGKHPFQNLAAAFIPLWKQDEPSQTNRILNAGALGKSWAEGVPLGAAINLALKESLGADRLLIVVDQFEELFTLVSAADRQEFIKALLDVGGSAPVTIVITLRADFYGQSINLDRALSDLIQSGIVNLGPMTREELRLAVERPAESVGLYFQEGLVERILDHIVGQPGHLPLLEFTLTELWERRQGTVLTNEQYDAIGGVEGAISERADALLVPLASEQQEQALRMLTRLVRVTAVPQEGKHTRRRVRLSELGEAMLPIVRSFAAARLLVTSRDELTGDETAELAHEALIDSWDRLKSYIDDDRDFLLWRQRLNFMMDEWKYSGFDRGVLLSRVPLAEAVSFAHVRANELNENEHAFIDSSQLAKIKRRRWAFVLVTIAVLALLAGSIWTAWRRSDTYQIQTTLSRGSRLAAASRTGADEEWLTALVYVGRTDEAFDIAKNQVQALAAITEALMKTGEADEARKTADLAYERASKIWANQESFPNSDARFEAFFAAARAYSAVGKTDEAVRAINEALSGREVDHLDVGSFSSLARLSVKVGNANELMIAVRKSGNESFRGFASREIAEALARNGKLNEALDAARDNKRSFVSAYDLDQITGALDRGALTEDACRLLGAQLAISLREEERESSDTHDKVLLKANAAQVLIRLQRKEEAEELIRAALQMATGIEKEKWKLRSSAYSTIVDALLKLDKLDDATIAYREITAQPIQMISASKLALKLIEAGRTQDALSVANKVREGSSSFANPVFAAIAIKVAIDGKPEDALAIVRNIRDSGGEHTVATADVFRSDALIGIAKALARMRRYRSALEILDQNPTLTDQLTVYSAVLREYANERNPTLAKSLEKEGDGDVIFPWLRE